MAVTLPELPYSYDSLQPFISLETMKLHHGAHHNGYVETANILLSGTDLEDMSLDSLQGSVFELDNQVFIDVIGQHYNHCHFWNWMKPDGGGQNLPPKLEKVFSDYGGYEKVRSDFISAGTTHFGSGWCWLVMEGDVLKTETTLNGYNPKMKGTTPILGCDLWEHSYYLDYKNKRANYLEAFFDNLVNWEYVEEMMG